MQAFANLLPLLLVLVGVFGLLITAALILRARVRGSVGAAPVDKTSAPTAMKPGDVAIVLGRTFQVGTANEIVLISGGAFLFSLDREDATARLIVANDLGYAYYLPNKNALQETDFPAVIMRKEGTFARQASPFDLAENKRIALYAGPNDRWLLVESAGETKNLWSGKAIPVEGITVLKEK